MKYIVPFLGLAVIFGLSEALIRPVVEPLLSEYMYEDYVSIVVAIVLVTLITIVYTVWKRYELPGIVSIDRAIEWSRNIPPIGYVDKAIEWLIKKAS